MPYIQNTDKSIQSPQARARGAGSAKSGTHHWWMQRLSSVALVPLSIWLLASVDRIINPSYQEVAIWLQNPGVAIGMLLFILIGFYHAAIGMQVVYEDYIHNKAAKTTVLVLSHLAFFTMAVMSIFSLMVVFFQVEPFQIR